MNGAAAPLLAAAAARVELDGGVLADGLRFELGGDAVGVVGDPSPVFAVLQGSARVTTGALTVLGDDAASAVAGGRVGLATAAPAMPPDWTVREYLSLGGRLAGVARRSAADRALAVLEELDLGVLSERRLGTLSTLARRAIATAAATLGAPAVLALDRPFAALPDSEVAALARVVARAAAGSRLVVGFDAPASVGAEARFLSRLDAVVVLEGGAVLAAGPPGDALGPGRRLVVRVSRNAEPLAAALRARGLRVTAPPSEDGRLVVHLAPDGSAAEVTRAALSADAPVLDLAPTGFVPRPRP